MEHLQFAYLWVFWYLTPILIVCSVVAFFFGRRAIYHYSLAGYVAHQKAGIVLPVRQILFFLRLLVLALLLFLIARPQWLDTQTTVNLHGVDIVLTIDMSGSMRAFDELGTRLSRIDAAKREALDFIAMRTNDPIGIVLFGAEAFSKVPLTLDKSLLRTVVEGLELGDVEVDGTAIMTALATAINRLRDSQAKSKIIVLLTDGMPTDETLEPEAVIALAKQFGIKIYTLGVGQRDVAYDYDAWGNVIQVHSQVDEKLLSLLAKETGGYFFRVYTPADLKKAYAKIDALEKTEYNTTMYHAYYEAFATFIWWLVALFFLELFLRQIWWRGLA